MRQAAFLRAINVGTHNRIKMVELRALCEGAGLTNVVTYLQTGNVLFDSDEGPEAVARALERVLLGHGLRNAAVIVRSSAELDGLLRAEPFGPYPVADYRRFVTLFRHDLPPDAAGVAAARGLQHFAVRAREICVALPVDASQGLSIYSSVEKRLKVQGTTRYWHVVEEIGEMMARG